LDGVGDDVVAADSGAGDDEEAAAEEADETELFEGAKAGAPEEGQGDGEEIEVRGDVEGVVDPNDLGGRCGMAAGWNGQG
jgi:hypothetical protein